MKKIIYSLVMTIALGGLFTSCVKTDEPDGVLDIRRAKADYIRALAELEKANTKIVDAEAAYKQALTAYENQLVLLLAAQTKEQELKNDLLALDKQLKQIEIDLAQAMMADNVKYNKDLKEYEIKLKKAELDALIAAAEASAAISAEELAHLKAMNAIELRIKEEEIKALQEGLRAEVQLNDLLIRMGEEELNKLIADNAHDAALKALELAIKEQQAAKKIQNLENQIEALKNEAQVAAINAQKDLANAQKDLEDALAAIALDKKLKELALSDEEKAAIEEAAAAYQAAAKKYYNSLDKYQKALADAMNNEYWQIDPEKVDWKAKYEKDLAKAQENLANWMGALDHFTNLDKEPVTWLAEWEKYKKEIDKLNHDIHKIQAQWAKDVVAYNNAFLGLIEEMQARLEELIEAEPDAAVLEMEFSEKWALPNNDFIVNQWKNAMSAFAPIVSFANDTMIVDTQDFNDVKDPLFQQFEITAEGVFTPGMKEVIETLEREYVVKDNADHAELLKSINDKKAAADKAYKDDKETLQKGRVAFVAAEQKKYDDAVAAEKAALAALNKAKSDSVAAEKAAKKALDDALAANQKAYEDAIKAAVDGILNNADKTNNDSFAYAVNYFYKTIGGNAMDEAKVFNAIIEYAKVLEAVGSKQSEFYVYKGTDAGGNILVDTVLISELKQADFEVGGKIDLYAFDRLQVEPPVSTFTPTAYGNVAADKALIYAYIIKTLTFNLTWDGATDFDENNMYVNGALVNTIDENSPLFDDIKAQALAAKNAADTAAKNAYKAVLAAEHDKVDDAQKAYDKAVAATTAAKNALLKKINDFYAIYDRFWGYNNNTTKVTDIAAKTAFPNTAGHDSLSVTWGDGLNGSKNTFTDPHHIVFFDGYALTGPTGNSIINNDDLAIVLYNLDNTNTDAMSSFIFRNHKYTEFAQTLYFGAWADAMNGAQYDNLEAALAKLKAIVNEIEAKYNECVAAVAEKKEAYEAAVAAWEKELVDFTGEEEVADAKIAFENLQDFFLNAPHKYDLTFHLEIMDVENPMTGNDFIDEFVNMLDGEYFAKGEALELIKKHLNTETGDFAEYLAKIFKERSEIEREIADKEFILDALNDVYLICLQHEASLNDPTVYYTNDASFDRAYANVLASITKKIEDAQDEVELASTALQKWNQGTDPIQIAAESKKLELAKLELAKDIAKKFFEEAEAAYKKVVETLLNNVQ